MLIEMHSAPAAGDLLDSRQYGPCEVVDVLATPFDRCQEAFVVLQMSSPFEALE